MHVCVGCAVEVGTYFLLVTFLSLKAVFMYVCECFGGVRGGSAEQCEALCVVLPVCEVSTFLPSNQSVMPPSAAQQIHPPTVHC